jgi:hypothetical protein
MKSLCGKVSIVALRRADPACAELRREFGIPYLNSCVVVLDAQGELLACWMGDRAGQGCTKESCDKFPGQFVAKIEESLQRAETREALIRRLRKSPDDAAVFEALEARITESGDYETLRKTCEAIASDEATGKDTRESMSLRAMIARSKDRTSYTPDGRRAFAKDAEKLLSQVADHALASALVQALFVTGYTGLQFDVPAKSQAGIDRLKAMLKDHRDPLPLKAKIEELQHVRTQWIDKTRETRERVSKNEYSRVYYGAMLGEVENTIRFFSQDKYSKNAFYSEWVREAKAKLAQTF